MPAPRKYPDELRERAVRMVLDALKDEPGSQRGVFRRVGEQLGINPETLRGWVRRIQIDAGDRPGTTTDDANRLAELEKEVRELRRANAILKSASAFSRRSSTAPVAELLIHRRAQGRVRNRADLPGPARGRTADRSEHLLRPRPTPALGTGSPR
ncbi:MAG: transposase [Dermabacter sp.]|nr:transposase [Dermabacter sp.]